MIENFLTTEQVAKILQVHPFTILKFIKQGKLRGVKLGRVYRMKESDVHEFLESRMTGENKSKKGTQPSPESDSGTFSDDSEQPSYHSQNPDQHHSHAYDSHPGSATHANYTLKKDENGEEGPPHYVI